MRLSIEINQIGIGLFIAQEHECGIAINLVKLMKVFDAWLYIVDFGCHEIRAKARGYGTLIRLRHRVREINVIRF